LVRTAARTAVIAGTATAVSGRVAHRQNEKYANQEADAYAQQQAYAAQSAPQPPPVEEPPYAAELEQLSQMKTRGIITEEEFQAKKKQILGI
jgi:hypothetical protein